MLYCLFGSEFRQRFRVIAVAALAALTLVCGGCGGPIGDDEARRTARLELEEYCAREKLDISDFRGPVMSSNDKNPWIFDYRSTGAPRHLVKIYVGADGHVEVNRMIEE